MSRRVRDDRFGTPIDSYKETKRRQRESDDKVEKLKESEKESDRDINSRDEHHNRFNKLDDDDYI